MTDAIPPRRPFSADRAPQHKSDLSRARQQLIELLQDKNFGWVKGLVVRAAEPVFDPPPEVVREVKFDADNEPRPERGAPDFRLKAQQVELMELIDRVRDGVIESIEFRHGLPFRARFVEPGKRPAA